MNFPDREPTLVGVDGNAYCVMGYVSRMLKDADLKDLVDEYTKDATSSDYNHLLATSCKYLDKAIEAFENAPDFPGWSDGGDYDDYDDEDDWEEDDEDIYGWDDDDWCDDDDWEEDDDWRDDDE